MYDPGLDSGSKKESTNRETKSSHKGHYGITIDIYLWTKH